MVSLSRSYQPATLHNIFGENVVYIIGKALSVENFVYIIGKGELSCTGTVFFFKNNCKKHEDIRSKNLENCIIATYYLAGKMD